MQRVVQALSPAKADRDSLRITRLLRHCEANLRLGRVSSPYGVIPALEAESVSISLEWLGATRDSPFRAVACTEAGEEAGTGKVSVGDGHIATNTVTGDGVMKYHLLID